MLTAGAEGVLMRPTKALESAHPLAGKDALLKIATRVAKVEHADDGFLPEDASPGGLPAGPETAALSPETAPKAPFPDAGAVEAEFNTLALPALAGLVPRVYGLVSADGHTVGYSIERLPGSLEDHIRAQGMDDGMERKVYAAIEGVCAVVSCFDVKPANFVVSARGDVKVIDFGPDFCAHVERKTPEHIAADVAMCTLLFCLAACKSKASLALPFLTSKLLDGTHAPLASAVAALRSLDDVYPEDPAISRAISSVTGNPCFAYANGSGKRGRWAEYSAIDLLTILSAIKRRDAGKTGFGRAARCAIL